MSKREILVTLYNRLQLDGFVDSKKAFAEALDYNYTCLSAAMNGEERYLTDRFFKRILRAYPRLNPDYVWNGRGDIYKPEGEGNAPDAIWPNVTEEVTNPNAAPNPNNHVYHIDVERFLAEIGEQRELTRKAQEQTEKALAQVDKLIEIIKEVSMNK